MNVGSRLGSRTARTLNQTVRVCRVCNNGWMAGLENRAKPLLTDLAEGLDTMLDRSAQEVLALWLAKNAIVHEPLADAAHRISTSAHRAAVASGQVPDGWHVAIGGYEGRGRTFEHHLGPVVTWPDDPVRSSARLTTHTTRLECFVGQIVVHSLDGVPQIAGLLGGDGYAVALPSSGLVHWPPPIPLTETWLPIVASLNAPRATRHAAVERSASRTSSPRAARPVVARCQPLTAASLVPGLPRSALDIRARWGRAPHRRSVAPRTYRSS